MVKHELSCHRERSLINCVYLIEKAFGLAEMDSLEKKEAVGKPTCFGVDLHFSYLAVSESLHLPLHLSLLGIA